MKQQIKLTSPSLTAIVLLYLFVLAGFSVAQTAFDSEPTAETEIICFAAQKQWVCAPADQKQQAHEKAMKLVEQKQSVEIDNNVTDNAQVEIKTMELNNDFNQQVQELPADDLSREVVIEQQTKDFVARREVNTSSEPEAIIIPNSGNEMVADDARESGESGTGTEVVVALTEQQIGGNSSELNNDFAFWQNHHSEQWSFQVIGTSNRHHLDQFLVSHELLQSKHAIVKTQVNSADWWVVLVGLYDSRDLAISQRDQLPPELAGQAWVRQIKSIVGEAD